VSTSIQRLQWKGNSNTIKGMSSRTIGFAVAEEDLERLGRLTEKFGKGNRSAFLREAMRQMETVERAERLAGLQAYGAERSAAAGLSPEDALDVVRRVLKQRL
jgi:Arc/MetJ-type ribon-helix-helix transcriptional regulator